MDYTDKLVRRNFYNSQVWRLKREEIKHRDNYECQWCKEEGGVKTDKHMVLEVDHIKELETHPELALEDDNLRTLCRDCHNKRHKRMNYKSMNPKNRNKWADDEWFGN